MRPVSRDTTIDASGRLCWRLQCRRCDWEELFILAYMADRALTAHNCPTRGELLRQQRAALTEDMLATGATQTDIAAACGIAIPTLREGLRLAGRHDLLTQLTDQFIPDLTRSIAYRVATRHHRRRRAAA